MNSTNREKKDHCLPIIQPGNIGEWGFVQRANLY